jgi:mRNA interferase RelE/StbE
LIASKKKALKQKYKYTLKFIPAALAEWNSLDGSFKEPLRKLLKKRLDNPHILGAELRGELNHCYKIKLLKQGYRLIYTVIEEEVIVLVLAVDKREDAAAYVAAVQRLRAKRQA